MALTYRNIVVIAEEKLIRNPSAGRKRTACQRME